MGSLWRTAVKPREARAIGTIDDYIDAVANSVPYGYGAMSSPMRQIGTYKKQYVDSVPNDLEGYAKGLFATNDAVFSVMDVRLKSFSTIRFQWQRINNGRPSELFGNRDLALLETPWVGGTTQDLLGRMEQDASLAGNAYRTVIGGEIIRLRPDWVQCVLTPRMHQTGTSYEPGQVGWIKLGYLYWESGIGNGEPVPFLPDEIAHYMPIPDPLAPYRGMSWLTPVIREAQNDKLMNVHKKAFFENAATPNLAVSLAKEVRPESFKRFVDMMNIGSRGPENAYKTLYLGGGADVQVIGTNFEQLDFSGVQGHGETRIAAAGGVPPIIAGFSEGLASATYSNYGQARRRFADGTLHPLWQNVTGSLQQIIPMPAGIAPGSVRLWYDTRDVPLLREDRRDAVAITAQQASTIRQLIEAGYEPDSVVRAVTSEDFGLLIGQHSGLSSVQLQPIVMPGTDGTGELGAGTVASAAEPAANAEIPEKAETPADIRLLMEMIQKVYLGVDKVVTAGEARELLNRGGANLPELPPDSPLLKPTEPPAAPPVEPPAEPDAEQESDDDE